MSRVNIKIDTETRERLQDYKQDHESWDDMMNRFADYCELLSQQDE
jgi:hypothetical protein